MKWSALLTTGWFALVRFALLYQGATAQVGYSCDELCDDACVEIVQNGGFENQFDHWVTEDEPGDCELTINDGTVEPFPNAVFTPKQSPIEGNYDCFTETINTGKCKLSQALTVPGGVTLAVLSWKDRIFMHEDDFADPATESMVRVCMGDHSTQTEIEQVWSTDPGDPRQEIGPNVRNYDVTAMVQSDPVQNQGIVDLVFEQNNSVFFFNSFWDAISLKVCRTTHQPIPDPIPDPAPSGGGMGDPHFKTWRGEWYDFHGICDMVLVHSEDFGNGLGLDIHLRTKPRYEYSYIEAAVVRIGDDILEVTGWGEYWLNGVGNADLDFIGDGFPITHIEENKKRHSFVIKTNEPGQESIVIRTFKDMVAVNVKNASMVNFGSSVGLMGRFSDGSLVGRDSAELIEKEVENHAAFGQTWQVLESEPQLFMSPSDQPFGTCVPPTATATARRRLAETVSTEAAERACAHFKDSKKWDMCVFDVVAMGDLEIVEAHGAY